jgi:hypothetical protein
LYFITCLNVFFSEGRGYQTDGIGCAFGEDDFVCMNRIQMLADGFTRLFIGYRDFLAECVYATVNIAVLKTVIMAHCINYSLGLLCGGSIVEIYKRFAMHSPREDREIFPGMGQVGGSA